MYRRNLVALMLTVVGITAMTAAEPAARWEQYRDFALRQRGDSEAGRRLYENHKQLACSGCHRITGMEKSGPNLDGIGDKYSRAQLVDEILRPSLSIKPGYEQTSLLTNDGRVLRGRLERSTQLQVRLIDLEGKYINVDTDEIQEMSTSEQSLMPDNAVDVLSKQEFADLVTYLESLTFGVKAGIQAGGEPVDIPHLDRPIGFRPIHPADVVFENPVWCGSIPGIADQLLVIEHQRGKIWRYLRDAAAPRREVFADLSDEIFISGNQGLMCIAFHPDFEQNRRYFLEYEVKEDGAVKTTIAERRASRDGLSDSGEPSKRLLEVEQPAFNHNGGCIAFGNDGMLYAAFGDGGPQEDPPGHSQNLNILLGSMIRIDVDHKTGDRAYGIPSDNPFVTEHASGGMVRPEIWAFGFREPWRFTFDQLTGDLLVGDVGQNKFEEVCLVKRGENHGWNVFEAYEPFSDQYRRDGEAYTEPLFAYEHGLGFSVTGGHVYRADPSSSFYGVYIFGDYNTRRVWGLRWKAGKLVDVREIGTAPGGIASFGTDDRGELILVTYDGGLFHLDLSVTEYR